MDLVEELSKVRVAAATEPSEAVEALLLAIDGESAAAGVLARALIRIDREEWSAALALLDDVDAPELAGEFTRARGEALLGDGRAEGALACFEALLADDPFDLDGRVGRARAWVGMGRVDDAEPTLRAALIQEPFHFGACLALGQLLLHRGRLEESLELVDRALALDALHPGPYRALTQLGVLLGVPEIAIGAYASRFANPLLVTPAMLVELADLYCAVGEHHRLPDVLRALERSAALDPGRVVELARYWYELEEADEIRGLADWFSPDHPGRAALEGLAAEAEGDLPAAVERYREALRGDPDLWLANARLAEALMLLDADLDEVEPLVARVEAQMSATPEAQVLRGILQLQRGDPAGADALVVAADHRGLRRSLRARAAQWLEIMGGQT